jgi:hypothetical protein
MAKRPKIGSDNWNVWQYLLKGAKITVADAREIGLTNDLKSRISDLRNKYRIEIESEWVTPVRGGSKYKRYWISNSVPTQIKIKVKNSQGHWLYGEYDQQGEKIIYRDGRTQNVSKEIFQKHLNKIIFKI